LKEFEDLNVKNESNIEILPQKLSDNQKNKPIKVVKFDDNIINNNNEKKIKSDNMSKSVEKKGKFSISVLDNEDRIKNQQNLDLSKKKIPDNTEYFNSLQNKENKDKNLNDLTDNQTVNYKKKKRRYLTYLDKIRNKKSEVSESIIKYENINEVLDKILGTNISKTFFNDNQIIKDDSLSPVALSATGIEKSGEKIEDIQENSQIKSKDEIVNVISSSLPEAKENETKKIKLNPKEATVTSFDADENKNINLGLTNINVSITEDIINNNKVENFMDSSKVESESEINVKVNLTVSSSLIEEERVKLKTERNNLSSNEDIDLEKKNNFDIKINDIETKVKEDISGKLEKKVRFDKSIYHPIGGLKIIRAKDSY